LKISRISIIAIVLVIIAVAIAGCSSTSPTTPGTTGGIPAATTAVTITTAGAPSGTISAPAGGATSGSDLFGSLSYNWVEYKMSTGSGSDAMTIYMKWNKQTGKCSMRFEGAAAQQMQGVPTEMDCGSTGQAQSNPNQVASDAQVSCSPIDESVTVPAGTFTATKCTVTSKGSTSTVWIVKDKFMVKMSASNPQGAVDMVLNAYG
jgi:hypothetical protein